MDVFAVVFVSLHLFSGVLSIVAAPAGPGFTFNGFTDANLTLDGMATITPEGLLMLTNTTRDLKGQAFYPTPVKFRRSVADRFPSFTTTFVFGIQHNGPSGQGLVFVISPSTDFSGGTPNQYFGIFNISNDGNPNNHIVAVELDTIKNPDLNDPDTNHVGVDVNGLMSHIPHTAGYYQDDEVFVSLNLTSGDRMQVWVDYDAEAKLMNVTLSDFGVSKPKRPLISTTVDLSNFSETDMNVGFSSTTGPFLSRHYILGWSFQINGKAELDLSQIPSLPHLKHRNRALVIWSPVVSVLAFLAVVGIAVFVVIRRIKFSELIEDWEKEYGRNRFPYRVLYNATGGFRSDDLLGSGGFGSVYRGILPVSKTEVAVKRISHESRQGMREFVAEIVTIGRLLHRNLVQLLGYCRRKHDLLLVYEFMPNSSLDKLLFDQSSPVTLNWNRRFRIIKGVALAVLYLHEEWEQVVIHRDIKASNVLLDGDMNGRLGDFGLARLYDHGSDPHTTHVVGTIGYLAPEVTKVGKATKAGDVFAFGALLLEVATGRRPVDPRFPEEEVILTDWVLQMWKQGEILSAADPIMGGGGSTFVAAEVDMVLKLGLLCSHPLAELRPNMRRVVRFLNGDDPLPGVSPTFFDSNSYKFSNYGAGDRGHVVSFVSSFQLTLPIGFDLNVGVRETGLNDDGL